MKCASGQAVRAIGRCAVTLERAAERCINVLLDLIKQKVNYVVQEAVVVITDIFRRYPNRCSSDSPALLCSPPQAVTCGCPDVVKSSLRHGMQGLYWAPYLASREGSGPV